MSIDRVRYRRELVEFHENAKISSLRYRDMDRHRPSVLLGSAEQLSTNAKLQRAVDEMRVKVKAELSAISDEGINMDELVERYRSERMPQEGIHRQRVQKAS